MTESRNDLAQRMAALEGQVAALHEEQNLKDWLDGMGDLRLSIGQFCKALGVSRYRLRTLYVRYALPIAEPKRQGTSPTYSLEDLKNCREILRHSGELI